jgi:hypothetical protein
MVLAIIPTVGDFHKSSNGLWLLSAKLLDIGFSSDAIGESTNRPIDRDIFRNIQKFSKTPNVRVN